MLAIDDSEKWAQIINANEERMTTLNRHIRAACDDAHYYGETAKLVIDISIDKDGRIVTIMSKDELE